MTSKRSNFTHSNPQALEYAKAAGALCMGITNTVGSALSRNTHFGVHITAGAEMGVASTKAYTSQIVALTMVALAISEDSISKRARRDAIIEGLRGLPDAVRRALQLDNDIKALAAELKEEENLLLFGRGYNYATALEGALKVKEVALMHRYGWGAVCAAAAMPVIAVVCVCRLVWILLCVLLCGFSWHDGVLRSHWYLMSKTPSKTCRKGVDMLCADCCSFCVRRYKQALEKEEKNTLLAPVRVSWLER